MTLTIYKHIEQGSQEWLDHRCGIMSASVMNTILTPTLKQSNNDKTRQAVYDLACQRKTGFLPPQYLTEDMIRGHEDEVIARDLYMNNYDIVDEVGGMVRDFDFGKVWYSPDGLVWDDGLIEIKSRREGLHFKTIAEGDVPKEHILQCQAALLISGRKWIDYISICKGMPLFVKRIIPEQEYQDAIISACESFESKVEEVTNLYDKNLSMQKVIIETERNDEEIEMEIYIGDTE